MKQCESSIHFMINAYFNFCKILWNFYAKLKHLWKDSMPIFKILWEVFCIINILYKNFGEKLVQKYEEIENSPPPLTSVA